MAEPSALARDAAAAAKSVQAAVRAASHGLVERKVLVELIALAAIAQEHVLVIGEPGTAKSEAVRRVAQSLGGQFFEYLLGRFTEPSELFGPIDLAKLQAGRVETVTTGMLPEADIVFLDEVFLGSTAILNSLLSVLNERRYRRGHSLRDVPLRVCVGAANALPEDVALAAFADRFLVRVFVSAVPDSELEALLAAGVTKLPGDVPRATLAELDCLVRAREAVDLTGVQPLIAHAVRLLRQCGIALTDRRIVRSQNLVSAAAAISGRHVATRQDLWPLVYVVPTALEQDAARDALRALLDQSDGPLVAAQFDASASASARAGRIVEAAETLLTEEPANGDRASWQLRLEGILREMDASFPRDALPEPLPALRERLAARLA